MKTALFAFTVVVKLWVASAAHHHEAYVHEELLVRTSRRAASA